MTDNIGPQRYSPATTARVKAQRSAAVKAITDAAEWQPKIDAVEARYADKWCGICGYEKRIGGICTMCFRT